MAKTEAPDRGLLLGTHVFLWWRENSRRLKAPARRAIERADVVLVSAATAWEVSTKAALGRLVIPDSVAWLTQDTHLAGTHIQATAEAAPPVAGAGGKVGVPHPSMPGYFSPYIG